MKKINKMTRSIVLSTIAALAFGGVALTTTYALFTSEATTDVSVTTGKVKVSTEIDADSIKLYSLDETSGESTALESKDSFTNGGTFKYNASTGAIELDKFTPGDKVEFTLTAKNESNVNIKYRTVLKTLEDNGLFQGLKVTVNDEEFDGSTTVSDYEDVLADKQFTTTTYKFSIELPKDAGNAYQEKKCTISFKLEAVQGNAKVSNPDQSVYEIYTPFDLAAFAKKIDSKETITYDKVVLKNDIDMNGVKYVSPNYAANHAIEFDGGSHTIKNFAPSQSEDVSKNKFIGLFGKVGVGSAYIHDVYFENVNMKGDFTVENDYYLGGGVVVGLTDAGASEVKIENVQLSGDISISDVKYAGGFVGFTSINTSITGCTIQSTGKVSISGYTAGGLVGQNGGKTTTIFDIAIGSDISVTGYKREGGLVGAGSGATTTTINFTDSNLPSHLKISNNAIAAQGTYVGLVSNTTINDVQYYTAIGSDDISKITVADKSKATVVEIGEGTYKGYSASFSNITGGIEVVGRGDLDKIVWVQANDSSRGDSFQATPVTMENVTLTSDVTNDGHYTGFPHASTLVFDSCNILVKQEKGVMGLWGGEDNTVTFNDCTFENRDHTPESNIFTYSGSEFNFNNCTFISEETAIKMYQEKSAESKDITINISKCEFKSTYDASTSALKDYKAAIQLSMDYANDDYKHYIVNIDGVGENLSSISGNYGKGVVTDYPGLFGIRPGTQTYNKDNVTLNVAGVEVDLGLSNRS